MWPPTTKPLTKEDRDNFFKIQQGGGKQDQVDPGKRNNKKDEAAAHVPRSRTSSVQKAHATQAASKCTTQRASAGKVHGASRSSARQAATRARG